MRFDRLERVGLQALNDGGPGAAREPAEGRARRFVWFGRFASFTILRALAGEHDHFMATSSTPSPFTFPTLDAWLTHLESAHPVGIDMGLTRISQVRDALGLTFKCPVITVGGTNGKGSTCAIIETILVRAGYRVGCHTSPHLLDFNERARLNGADATNDELLEHFEAVEQARMSLADPVSLTYFEFTTLAIMRLFASRDLDAVILEVGLGGRLDAVNIIDTDCAIVTSIDIDHTEYLGDTCEKIGFEKAGIFRPNTPAICGDPRPAVIDRPCEGYRRGSVAGRP